MGRVDTLVLLAPAPSRETSHSFTARLSSHQHSPCGGVRISGVVSVGALPALGSRVAGVVPCPETASLLFFSVRKKATSWRVGRVRNTMRGVCGSKARAGTKANEQYNQCGTHHQNDTCHPDESLCTILFCILGISPPVEHQRCGQQSCKQSGAAEMAA